VRATCDHDRAERDGSDKPSDCYIRLGKHRNLSLGGWLDTSGKRDRPDRCGGQSIDLAVVPLLPRNRDRNWPTAPFSRARWNPAYAGKFDVCYTFNCAPWFDKASLWNRPVSPVRPSCHSNLEFKLRHRRVILIHAEMRSAVDEAVICAMFTPA
jgi:hypothetical protein